MPHDYLSNLGLRMTHTNRTISAPPKRMHYRCPIFNLITTIYKIFALKQGNGQGSRGATEGAPVVLEVLAKAL